MENIKRIACLYRVSTTKQVSEDGDIPMQENACREFIKNHADWIWDSTLEYYERGVSGFKKKASEREVIGKLKADAEARKFDVLLVFMLDRIGRREDETPFLVNWFINLGIEVWSVKEGQQKIDTHIDKLTNYLKYWQASGESIKTGLRVKESHVQMVKSGELVCNPPYGYKLELTGKINKKGKATRKIVIIPKEAEVVKLMYDLCLKQGFGGLRIAEELNNRKIPTRKNSIWQSATINHLLRNPIFKGYPAICKTQVDGKKGRTHPDDWILSEKQVNGLVIIPEDIWDKVQKVRNARTPDKYKQENIDYSNYPMQTKGNLLLAGFIYCGYCGGRLSNGSSYDRWTTKDGVSHKKLRGAYKCINKTNAGTTSCKGKCNYKQEMVEESVIEVILGYMEGMKKIDYSKELEFERKKVEDKYMKDKQNLESQIKSLSRGIENMNEELAKCFRGENRIPMEKINQLIEQDEEKKRELIRELDNMETEQTRCMVTNEQVMEIAKAIPVWREEFEKTDIGIKKILLANIIDRVDVKDGEINVSLKMEIKEFLENYLHKSRWDVDSLDWKDYGVDAIIEKITNHKHLGNGSIILCHNGAKYTADALESMILKLKENGYEIVPISELIYTENYEMDHEGRQFLKQ